MAEAMEASEGWRTERRWPTSKQEARREIQATRNRISRDLDALERRLNSATGGLGTHWVRRLRSEVRDDPVASLTLAFGAGIAAGALVSAARDRRSWPAEALRQLRRHLPRALREAVGG